MTLTNASLCYRVTRGKRRRVKVKCKINVIFKLSGKFTKVFVNCTSVYKCLHELTLWPVNFVKSKFNDTVTVLYICRVNNLCTQLCGYCTVFKYISHLMDATCILLVFVVTAVHMYYHLRNVSLSLSFHSSVRCASFMRCTSEKYKIEKAINWPHGQRGRVKTLFPAIYLPPSLCKQFHPLTFFLQWPFNV